MLYNYFVSGGDAASVAQAIVNVLKKYFNTGGKVQELLDSLILKLNALYQSFNGNFSPIDIGGCILDLAALILTILPSAKLSNIIAALWEISNIL